MINVLICAIPLMHDVERPPGAPAMLKSAANKAGHTAQVIDLNLEWFNEICARDIDRYYNLGCVWRPYDPVISEAEQAATKWCDHCIGLMLKIQPRVIAISVFTNFQHRAAWRLCRALREHCADISIILGGFGCEITASSLTGAPDVTRLDQVKPFWQLMRERGLADHVALGGGGSLEDFVSFLDHKVWGKTSESVPKDETVIYTAPIPDYSDYRLDQYLWREHPSLAITGSKGCVRSCTFCDIPGQFGRFRYRRGEDIANEMILQHQRHGIKVFEFTDSLVNGSLKAFREWLTLLANHNDTRPESEHIGWFGQYICRSQNQTPSDIYDLMRRSGVKSLIIGVESGSNAVLEAMNKKMMIEDVYDELAQFHSHGIQCEILMLSSFYNETYERFVETLYFLKQCQEYVANGTIGKLSMGTPLFINKFMFIGQHAEELGILLDENHHQLWTMVEDPDNTYLNRARRRVTAQLIMDLLGYPLSSQNISNLRQILNQLIQMENKLLEELNETTKTFAV